MEEEEEEDGIYDFTKKQSAQLPQGLPQTHARTRTRMTSTTTPTASSQSPQAHKDDTKQASSSSSSKVAEPLDVPFIHQVLLTGKGGGDCNDTDTTNEQAQHATPTFQEFRESLQPSSSTTAAETTTTAAATAAGDAPVTIVILDAVNAVWKKGAYRDALVQQIMSTTSSTLDTTIVSSCLVKELHDRIRRLIPSSRSHDWSGWLRENDNKNDDDDNDDKNHAAEDTTTIPAILQLLVQAATALAPLESLVRAETTLQWIQQTNRYLASLQDNHDDDDDNIDDNAATTKSRVLYLVDSLLYLFFKTELNEADQLEFYRKHWIIPHILNHGIDLERQAFERQFGPLTDVATTAPVTRAWIQSLVVRASSRHDMNEDGTLASSTARCRELFTRGWIEDIIFRSASSGSFSLPEVFAHDLNHLRRIRHVTRLAAAGSALAVYACQATGQSTNILQQQQQHQLAAIHDDNDDDGSLSLDLRRRALLQAMNESWNNQEAYEAHVTDAVLALAREFQPSLADTVVATLKRQTQKVLRGEDAVLTLLNRRMQEGFCEMVITGNLHKKLIVPTVMRTGRLTKSTNHKETKDNQAWSESLHLFHRRGLAFYATELTMAAQLAGKIVDLAWNIYGVGFLDRLILAAEASSLPPQN